MARRYTAGIISATAIATGVFTGIWTRSQQLKKIAKSDWVGNKVTAGPTPGVDYVVLTTAPTGASSKSITHPAIGYTGTLKIFLCGTSSLTGSFWDYGSDAAYNGTGETALWTYTCLGDETSFTLQQLGFDSYASPGDLTQETLKLIINGGVNNGKFVCVGSARANGTGYGHGGACCNQSGYATLTTATRNAYGGERYLSSTCYYSDSTSYSPDSYATYGGGAVTYQVGSDASALVMNYGGSNAFGMSYRPTSGSGYTNYSTITSSYSYSYSRSPAGFGAAILVFKND